MAGENAALWEVQDSAADGLEATASGASVNNVALFNDTAKVIGTQSVSYLSDFTVNFRRAVPENEAVNADNNELQDMGIDGLDIVLTGVSGDADNDVATNLVNKLSKWLQDGNKATGFTKGRFGLRLDNAPQWNVVPTSALGFHIKDAQFQYMGERKDLVQFTIRLALGGDIATAI
jgi:hypothetical protein